MARFAHDFSQIPFHPKARTGALPAMQRKTSLDLPRDPYEKEADQVADAIMQMADGTPGKNPIH